MTFEKTDTITLRKLETEMANFIVAIEASNDKYQADDWNGYADKLAQASVTTMAVSHAQWTLDYCRRELGKLAL